MDNTKKTSEDPQALLQEWLKNANQFWSGVTKSAEDIMQTQHSGQKGSERSQHEALYSIMKTWGTISSAMSEPSAMETLYRGMAIMPDIISKIIQSGIRGYLKIYGNFLEKMVKLGQRTDAYSFDNLDQESLRVWSDIYEKEIHRYFNVPQLGLNRFYQERMSQAFDKYNVFNTSLLEFMNLLSMPFEKSFHVMQGQIDELTQKGLLPEDPQEIYRMWIKSLEGHFMTLYKSPEYTKVLASTLSSLDDFIATRNMILQDILQPLPIPTNKDMDALYEEIYFLKKKVKELEKGLAKK